MKDFFSRHSYVVIWVLSLVIIGSLAILIVKLDETIPELSNTPRNALSARQIPAAPLVTVAIQKSTSGNSFVVQWENLPNGTVALEIFRGKTGTDPSTWTLWNTIQLSPDQLVNGNATINLGLENEDGYSFYEEAVTGGDPGNTPPLWTSSSTVPVVTTSTPPTLPPNNPNQPPENPGNESSSTNSTSTNPNTPDNNPSSTPGSGNSPTTPTGTPYYNPEVQISGYGNAPGDFWLQHVNQSIEIGWQNLPPDIGTIVVTRSQDSNGPWNTLITQQNPGTSGSYSLQIVDNTINQPYYYEMTAFNGTTTIATYGPVYLAPN
jgi:hypothetical protein